MGNRIWHFGHLRFRFHFQPDPEQRNTELPRRQQLKSFHDLPLPSPDRQEHAEIGLDQRSQRNHRRTGTNRTHGHTDRYMRIHNPQFRGLFLDRGGWSRKLFMGYQRRQHRDRNNKIHIFIKPATREYLPGGG